MSEWIQCTSCGLRFRARTSCPRCRQSVAPPSASVGDVFDEATFASRQAERAAAQSAGEPRASGAVLAAGAILALNGLLQLTVSSLESSAEGATSLVAPWLASFDLVVGGILLSGQPQVRHWATTRAVLGGVALAVLHAMLGHRSSALLGVLFGAGLLLLLVGRAGRMRVTTGAVTASVAAFLAALAAAPFVGYRNPIGALAAGMNGEVDAQPIAQLRGERVGYRLALADGRWHRVQEEPAPADRAAPRDDEGAEPQNRVVQELSASVRRPDVNLELQMMGMRFPRHVTLDPEKAMDALVDDVRDRLPELMVTEDHAMDSSAGPLRVLEGTAWVDGQRTAVALGLGMSGQCVVMMSGTAPPRMYPKVRDGLMDVFSSLETQGCEGMEGIHR